MTAVEFLKTKRRIPRLMAVTGILAIVGWLSVSTVIHSNTQWLAGEALFTCLAIGPSILLSWLIIWLFRFLEKRFVRQHPEMEHLNEWMRVRGHAALYPVNGIEKVALIPHAAYWLECAARSANAAIAAREGCKVTRNGYRANSVERAIAQKGYEALAAIAQATIDEYFKLWNLLVRKLAVLSGEHYDHPRTYREGFLVNQK